MKIDEYRSIAIHWHDRKRNRILDLISYVVETVSFLCGRMRVSEIAYVTIGPNGEKLKLRETLEPMPMCAVYYTLIADGRIIGEFYGWPHKWTRDYAKDVPVPKLSEGEDVEFVEAGAATENAALATWLATPINWTKTDAQTKRVGNLWITHRATGLAGEKLMLALGDFPDEDLYTLYVDGTAVVTLNDFPPAWNGESDGGENEPTGKCPHCGK